MLPRCGGLAVVLNQAALWLHHHIEFELCMQWHAHLVVASAVASERFELETLGEASVAVHDEGDVPWHRAQLQDGGSTPAKPPRQSLHARNALGRNPCPRSMLHPMLQ
jgi:hypothetical protein